jgi:type IV pilus assembly protein PilA
VKKNGFSLIELLIVVAIILLIAAIAIPNFLKARMAANESAAASGIRTINTAELSYLNVYPTMGYASIASLGSGGVSPCVASSATACLIDDSLAVNGTVLPGKSGYLYSGSGLATTYYAEAHPVTQDVTGVRSFCSIQDATVRVNTAGGAISSSAACSALPGQN